MFPTVRSPPMLTVPGVVVSVLMIPSYPALVANPRPTLKLVVVKRRAAAAARHDQHPSAGVFPGGPGKTTSPADFASLMNDLESKIFGRFDDDTVVHPGHGDDTTL